MSSAGCTNGTFVDTATYPRVTGANNDLVEDCLVLVAVQNHWASNTANNNLPANHRLRSWGTSANQKINTWPGITVYSKRVAYVNLSNTSRSRRNSHFLSGTIPPQLGNLSALTKLDLGGNRLTGNIPTQLAHLSRLVTLRLYLNRLTGTIPTQFARLSNLTSLYLNYNRLTGNIPAQLAQLSRLKWIKLNSNRLTGTIPAQLARLSDLRQLSVGYNQLTGNISAGLASLARFTTLGICQNYLTGSIPTGLRTGITLIGYPTSRGYNPIACQRTSTPTPTPTTRPTTATFPPCPDGIVRYGCTAPPTTAPPRPTTTRPPASRSIPRLLAAGCTNGIFVDTAANPRITGANNDLVEDCLALVAAQNHWASNATNSTSVLASSHPLRTWGTRTNQKINTWPGITVSSKRVTRVDLSNSSRTSNFINGTIPIQIGNLSALTRLDLGGNRLSGTIPAQLGRLTQLTTLRLYLNSLTGSIPTQLGQLTNLTSLYLNNNQLTGTIPTQLAQLTKLKWLKLNQNNLFGSIPSQLGQLTQLNLLNLSYNRLTGTIPTQLAQLTRLTTLAICQNRLTGSVPTGLRTGVTLTSYPTSSGYNPIACQRTSTSTASTTPTTTRPTTTTATTVVPAPSVPVATPEQLKQMKEAFIAAVAALCRSGNRNTGVPNIDNGRWCPTSTSTTTTTTTISPVSLQNSPLEQSRLTTLVLQDQASARTLVSLCNIPIPFLSIPCAVIPDQINDASDAVIDKITEVAKGIFRFSTSAGEIVITHPFETLEGWLAQAIHGSRPQRPSMTTIQVPKWVEMTAEVVDGFFTKLSKAAAEEPVAVFVLCISIATVPTNVTLQFRVFIGNLCGGGFAALAQIHQDGSATYSGWRRT